MRKILIVANLLFVSSTVFGAPHQYLKDSNSDFKDRPHAVVPFQLVQKDSIPLNNPKDASTVVENTETINTNLDYCRHQRIQYFERNSISKPAQQNSEDAFERNQKETELFNEYRKSLKKEEEKFWQMLSFSSNQQKINDVILDELSDARREFINYTDENGDTFLHFICRNSNLKFITELVEAIQKNPCADWNIRNKDGDTPLLCAIRNKNYEAVKILLKNHSVDCNIKDAKGNFPLQLAFQPFGNSEE